MQINWPFWIVCQTQVGIPYAFGVPGTGKTMIANAAARLFGREFIQFLLSHCTPEDMLGLPMLGKIKINGMEHEVTRFVPTETLVRATHGYTFVLLDEANHCRPAVQAAAQERWFNNTPPNAMVAAIANPPEMATEGFELAPAVVNRLCILDWEHNHDVYIEGLREGSFADPCIPVLPKGWRDYCNKWRNLLADYAAVSPESFDASKTFPRKPNERSKPWASPRSWYRVAVNLAAAEAVGATEDVAEKVCSGFVGEGHTKQFFGHLRRMDLPNSKEIYDDPKRLKMPPRFDTRMAIISGVLAHAKIQVEASDDPGAAFEKAMDFCDYLFPADAELATAVYPQFVSLKPAGHTKAERPDSDIEKAMLASL